MSETVKDLIRRVREHIDAGITAGHDSAVTPDDFLRRDCHYSLCLSYGELRVLLDYIAEVERSWDEDKNVLASALAAARAQLAEAQADLAAARQIPRLLAGVWLYGDFRAETAAEREMEACMARLGLWPLPGGTLADREAALGRALAAQEESHG